MRFYVLVSFWTLILSVFAYSIFIINNKYPRTLTYKTPTEDLMYLLMRAAVAVWASNLLWPWL